jgi:S-formylglutathione hydrolase
MIVHAEIECAEVGRKIEYAVLRPTDGELPLLYILHGGGGSRDHLERVRPALERAWAEGTLPPLVAVTPTAGDRTFYMNLRDGSERWEDALIGPFLEGMRRAHGARDTTLICGSSTGGTGALRLAFKHPDVFTAVAALEPSLAPALDYADIEPRDRFWHRPGLVEHVCGSPIDAAYWRANHPTAIAHDDPQRLRDLAIYLECGDEDSFGFYRGAELLHRILFDRGIRHEYRLVRGADHVGATLPGRFLDALRFLANVLDPPPPDPAVATFRDQVARMKRDAGIEAG